MDWEGPKWRNSPLTLRDPSTWNLLQEVKTQKQPEVGEDELCVKCRHFQSFEDKVDEKLSDLKEKVAALEANALMVEQLERRMENLEQEKAALKERLKTVEKELLEFQARENANNQLNTVSATLSPGPNTDDLIEDDGKGGNEPSEKAVEGGSAEMEVNEGEGREEKQLGVRIAKEVEQEDEVFGTIERGRMSLEHVVEPEVT